MAVAGRRPELFVQRRWSWRWWVTTDMEVRLANHRISRGRGDTHGPARPLWVCGVCTRGHTLRDRRALLRKATLPCTACVLRRRHSVFKDLLRELLTSVPRATTFLHGENRKRGRPDRGQSDPSTSDSRDFYWYVHRRHLPQGASVRRRAPSARVFTWYAVSG